MGKAKKVKGTRKAGVKQELAELRTFTTPELAKLLKVPLRKAISFLERGYIRASEQEAYGHGSKREFNYDDVLNAMVIRVCEDMGLKVEKLRELAHSLEAFVLEGLPLPECFILTPGATGLTVTPEGHDVMSAVPKHTKKELATLVISVKAIKEELLKRMREENMVS